jgi:DNA repair protein RAD5
MATASSLPMSGSDPLERESLAEHALPVAGVTARLARHQLQALTWMATLETRAHGAHRGGLLLDDPGLGKTVTMLALVVRLPECARVNGYWGTLVVATVPEVWLADVRQHLTPEAARRVVCIESRAQLEEWSVARMVRERRDIVVTRYSTLLAYERAHSAVAEAGSLVAHAWLRVVLDEAHAIRTATTKVNAVVSRLRSYYRWAITGTPLHNRVSDSAALVHWVRGAYSDARALAEVRDADSVHRALLAQALRRTEARHLQLPPRTDTTLMLEFAPCERRFYRALTALGRQRIERLIADASADNGGGASTTSSTSSSAQLRVFEWILRLRQAATHPYLAFSPRLIAMWLAAYRRMYATAADPAGDAALRHTQCRLTYEASLELAAACFEQYDVSSGVDEEDNAAEEHGDDAEEAAEGDGDDEEEEAIPEDVAFLARAAQWRRKRRRSARPPPPAAPSTKLRDTGIGARPSKERFLEWLRPAQSSKGVAMAALLADARCRGTKVIVVSQWVTAMTLFARSVCDVGGFRYLTLSGASAPAQREALVDRFRSDPAIGVLLMSLKLGESRTIVEASEMILLDQWWNVATEHQAIKRIHRWRQTRETRVWYLRMLHSVEISVERLRRQKARAADTVLDGRPKNSVAANGATDDGDDVAAWVRNARETLSFDDVSPSSAAAVAAVPQIRLGGGMEFSTRKS